MRRLKARVGKSATVTFINQRGEHCMVPLIAFNGGWRQVGVYLVYGTSKNDPAYAAVHALPHGWVPTRQMLRAIERAP